MIPYDQGLIVVTVYYFQSGNKKEHDIIIWVISSHIGPIYIETPYKYLCNFVFCYYANVQDIK